MRTLLLFLLVLAIALVPGTVAFAQDMDEPVVFCGDLPEEDCDLLKESALAMESMTSGTYDATMDLLVTGLPEVPFNELAINWNQQAAYVTDPAFSEEMAAMSDEDAMAMASDPEAAVMFAMEAFDAIDTEQQTTIVLGDETAELLSANIGYPLPSEMVLRFTIVDGIGYINLDDLAAIVPEMAGMTGWVGTELRPVLEWALANADLEAASSDDMAQLAPMMAMASPEAQMEFFGEYLNIESGGPDNPAIFRTTFDLAAFVTSPEFIEMIVSQIEATEGAPISAGDIQQAQSMLPMVAPMLFGGLSSYGLQAIDRDTAYTVGASTTFEWDLTSLLSMAAMTGALPPAPAGTQTFIGFNSEVLYGDQNAIESISPPENAMVVPGETVVQMLESAE